MFRKPNGRGDMKKTLLIIGAGGLGREVVDMLQSSPDGGGYELVFLDDSVSPGTMVHGVNVLGSCDCLWNFSTDEADVCIAIGSPLVRKKLVAEIHPLGFSFATIVDPTALVRPTAVLGAGVIVGARTFLSCNTSIGAHVVLNPGAIVGHDVGVGPYVVVGGGANISGGARIGEGSLIGAGACILRSTSVGSWCIVGMGATVYTAVQDGLTVLGNPGRPLPVQSKAVSEVGPRQNIPLNVSS